jgi:branched-chain amino acid transport system substrate-binding protein
MIKKRTLTRFAVFQTAAILLAGPALAADKVKIGFVNTFSGPNAAIGEDSRNGFNLALEHLGHKMGGIPVDVAYEDDQQKPEVSKQVVEKLLQSNKVDFLTGFNWSNTLLASLKPAIDAQTFIISANAGPSAIAGELCSPWFFSASWQNDQTPMATGELLNRKGVKKLYVLAPNYAAGKDMAAGVKSTFKGEVVGEEYTRWPGQLDFSAELSKVRAAKPDAVWVFYPGAAGPQFFTQFSQAGLKDVTLYSTFTVDAVSLSQIGDIALGSTSAQSWVQDLDIPANKKFVADFRKKHGIYPSQYGAQAYDAVMLIDAAVRSVGGDLSKKDEMRAAMRKADFQHTRGKWRYGNNHFPIQDFYMHQVVKDSEGKLTLKMVEVITKDHQDLYHDKCPMKW